MGFKLVYFMRKHECAWWSGVDGGCSPPPTPSTAITTAAATPTRSRFRCKDQKRRRQTWLYDPRRRRYAAAVDDGVHMLFTISLRATNSTVESHL